MHQGDGRLNLFSLALTKGLLISTAGVSLEHARYSLF